MSTQQERFVIESLQKVGLGVLEACSVAGDQGAPGGVLYAAMMTHGATQTQFESFMSGLVGKGMLNKEDDCYVITDAGQAFMATLQAKFGAPRADVASRGARPR